MTLRSALFTLTVSVAFTVAPIRADVILQATNNATIQPGGPRTGSNGKRFFNMEGSVNGTFSSFGVIDFTVPATANGTFNSLTLKLTQDDASFTHPGSLAFYVVTNTTAGIDPGNSPLVFQSSNLPGGVGTQLGTEYFLGTGSFTGLSDGSTQGRTDTFSFALSGNAQTYVDQDLSSGNLLRLLVTPNDATVAATYAGYTDTLPGPMLTVSTGASAAPEPAAAGLLIAGGLILGLRRVLGPQRKA